ncbi:ComEC family competence protein [Pirellulimonas nuda]|uniref:ComEC family competence protein n=1 Tax=Pirellulimonas nuda TaxID=2528009 RepID=A0A518D9T4_9BACT|nr:ComEC/Rec2 family competence protein [Pirellulimonas nuda]QDU88242.1 ComEC family competence protein [Pirellulimonas nuda]
MPNAAPLPRPLALLRDRRDAAAPVLPSMVVAAVAMAVGVGSDRVLGPGAGVWLIAAVLLLLIWRWLLATAHTALAAWALVAAIAAAAGGWGDLCWSRFGHHELGRYASYGVEPVAIEGLVVEGPVLRPAGPPSPYRAIPENDLSTLTVAVSRLRDGAGWVDASGLCSLTIDGSVESIAAGDRLRVFAQLRRPLPPMNPGQQDTAGEARGHRRLCLLRAESAECVSVLGSGSLFGVQRTVEAARGWLSGAVRQSLSGQEAELTAAMLFGQLEGLSDETTDAFRRVGLMHVLVVSGLHTGIVASVVLLGLRLGLARRAWSIALVMAVVAAYAVVAGGRPPVVRAAVFAELFCVAALLGRPLLSWSALGAAALIVMVINPSELFRVGTQLSFLTAAVLLAFGQAIVRREPIDPLDRLLASVRPWPVRGVHAIGRWGWRLLAATLVVQMIAAPLVLSSFHLVSPAALPLTLLAMPLVVACIGGGLGLVLLGPLGLGAPLAWLCDHAAWTLLWATGVAQRTPGSHFWSPAPYGWWIAGFYGLVALAYFGRRSPGLVRLTVWGAPVWLAAAFLPAAWQETLRDETEVAFLSVGHGACVVVRPPGGGVLMYDAGALSSPEGAAEAIAAYLWSRGERRIDVLVLSHADIDHFNAVPELAERFSIGATLVSSVMFPRWDDPTDASAPVELRRLLKSRGVPIRTVELGEQIKIGPLTGELLHPTALGVIDTDNANSVVLGLEYGGARVLLTGDLEGAGMRQVVAQEKYDCTVVMTPHHGSPRSDPPGFCAWCSPEVAVVSGSLADPIDEVSASYHAGGAEVLSTAQVGAALFYLGSEDRLGVRQETFLPTPLAR